MWGRAELYAAPMHKALEPFEQSRDNYEIFTGLAERLGFADKFTDGRTPREWIEYLWTTTVQRGAQVNVELPDFHTFWYGGVFSLDSRAATLAAAMITDSIRPGVVVLPTGAWYDPQDPAQPCSLEVHGNPNVLTRDLGTLTLAQGTSAHSCLVEVERYDDALPEIKVFRQPPIE